MILGMANFSMRSPTGRTASGLFANASGGGPPAPLGGPPTPGGGPPAPLGGSPTPGGGPPAPRGGPPTPNGGAPVLAGSSDGGTVCGFLGGALGIISGGGPPY